jgi:hypothetical protein
MNIPFKKKIMALAQFISLAVLKQKKTKSKMVNAYLYIVFIIGVCVFTSLCDYSKQKNVDRLFIIAWFKNKSPVIESLINVCVTKKKKQKNKDDVGAIAKSAGFQFVVFSSSSSVF